MNTTRVSLLVRIKDPGNARAWSEFDAIYRPILHRFASARGLGEAAAEDVVQHCLAAVHTHIARFDYDPDKGRFRSWLRTLVNNHIRNQLRKRPEPNVESRHFRGMQSREESPEAAFDRMWQEEHLKHCLRKLRAEVEAATYMVFQRYVMDEWPVERVCTMYKMNRNQVYKIKWRITQKLQEKMRMLMDGEGSGS